MSVDTISRVNAYFASAVADVLPVYTIYKNVNEDLPESGSGPFVKLWVEPSLDTLLADAGQYQEDGVVIAQVFVEEGESSLVLHSIMDSIKVAFRQVQLAPTGSEIGLIAFEDIDYSNSGTIETEDFSGNIPWRQWDIFIAYSKYDCDAVIANRYFTTLNSSLSQYFNFPPAVLTGDYTIMGKFYLLVSGIGANKAIIGAESGGGDFTVFLNSGSSAVNVQYPTSGGNNYELSIPFSSLTDDSLLDFSISRLGDTVTLTIDGQTDTLTRNDFMQISFGNIGSWIAGLLFDGIISDIKVYDENTMLIRDYPIDETWKGFGTDLIDYSGNNLNGTAINITDADAQEYFWDGSKWEPVV